MGIDNLAGADGTDDLGNLGKPDHIPNWGELLGSEASLTRVYVIPKDPAAVRTLVADAVFQTLTRHALIESKHSKIAGAMPTEETELGVLENLEEFLQRRDAAGLHEEAEEALKQAKRAGEADLDDEQPWRVHYDYWNDQVKIGETLRLTQPAQAGEYLLLHVPLAEMGEDVGFPETLVKREVQWRRRENQPEATGNPEQRMAEVTEKLGFDAQRVKQGLFDSQIGWQFIDALGSERVNEILAGSGLPSTQEGDFWERQREVTQLVYPHLTDAEKDLVSKERNVVVSGNFYRDIEENGQQATVKISVQANGVPVRYEGNDHQMTGALPDARYFHISYQMEPTITPDTRHDALVPLREYAIQQADTAGFP